MRIKCAACGHTHDDNLTPFPNNVVREDHFQKEEVPVFNDELSDFVDMFHYSNTFNSEFLCGKCGVVNNVSLKWNAVRSKEEVENESA